MADAANCSVPSKSFSLTIDGQTIVWRNGDGEIDIETVMFNGEDQFVTTTVKSLHAVSTRNIAPGRNWVYSRDGDGRLQVQPSGRNSFGTCSLSISWGWAAEMAELCRLWPC